MLSDERKAELRREWNMVRPGEVLLCNTQAETEFGLSLGGLQRNSAFLNWLWKPQVPPVPLSCMAM